MYELVIIRALMLWAIHCEHGEGMIVIQIGARGLLSAVSLREEDTRRLIPSATGVQPGGHVGG